MTESKMYFGVLFSCGFSASTSSRFKDLQGCKPMQRTQLIIISMCSPNRIHLNFSYFNGSSLKYDLRTLSLKLLFCSWWSWQFCSSGHFVTTNHSRCARLGYYTKDSMLEVKCLPYSKMVEARYKDITWRSLGKHIILYWTKSTVFLYITGVYTIC